MNAPSQKASPLRWIIPGCLGFFLLGFAFVAWSALGPKGFLSRLTGGGAPFDATVGAEHFLTRLRAREYPQAHAMLGSDFAARHLRTVADLQAHCERDRLHPASWNLGRPSPNTSPVSGYNVEGTVSLSDGTTLPVLFRLTYHGRMPEPWEVNRWRYGLVDLK